MMNQPNSIPLHVQSGGKILNNFMKRVENERDLLMSKSGIEHIQIRFPTQVNNFSQNVLINNIFCIFKRCMKIFLK